ncbi:hypothetical protein Dimus_039040 [Dionaea muscipula]
MNLMKTHAITITKTSYKSQTTYQSIPNPCPSSNNNQTQSCIIKNPSNTYKPKENHEKPNEIPLNQAKRKSPSLQNEVNVTSNQEQEITKLKMVKMMENHQKPSSPSSSFSSLLPFLKLSQAQNHIISQHKGTGQMQRINKRGKGHPPKP